MKTADTLTSIDQSRGRGLSGLMVLNVALLGLLAWITFGAAGVSGGSAGAQPSGRGDYTMVAGGVNGAESGAVWIVNGGTQELIAVYYDFGQKNIVPIGYRNLAKDMAQLTGGR